MKESFNSKICIPISKGFFIEEKQHIVCCRAYGHNSIISFIDKEAIIVPRRIGLIEKKLDGNFIRCHKSFLINLKYVKEFLYEENKIILVNGEIVNIAMRKTKEIKDLLFDKIPNFQNSNSKN